MLIKPDPSKVGRASPARPIPIAAVTAPAVMTPTVRLTLRPYRWSTRRCAIPPPTVRPPGHRHTNGRIAERHAVDLALLSRSRQLRWSGWLAEDDPVAIVVGNDRRQRNQILS